MELLFPLVARLYVNEASSPTKTRQDFQAAEARPGLVPARYIELVVCMYI